MIRFSVGKHHVCSRRSVQFTFAPGTFGLDAPERDDPGATGDVAAQPPDIVRRRSETLRQHWAPGFSRI